METKKILDKNGLEYYTGKIKQQIPKKTSDLTNDSNFIDNTYTSLDIDKQISKVDEGYVISYLDPDTLTL